MKIRKLTSSDIQDIENFKKENPPEKGVFIYPDIEEYNFVFNNQHSNLFGLYEKNHLIGWGGYLTGFKDYSLKKEFFELSAIYIAKTHRHKGLGQFLLDEILNQLKTSEKYKKIFLTVSPRNISAIILYLKNGFVVFDFKKNYYGKGEDRLFMSLV